jgi:DNA-binding NarL/FixJ family response regulator
MTPLCVLLADDHALFRQGVASLLAAESGVQVVGEAVDGRQALEMARELMPDVVLMDLSMPVMDGLEATRRIKSEIPYVRIVILTALESDELPFEALKSGAQGCLTKGIEPQALLSTLDAVVRGEALISRSVAARILKEFTTGCRPAGLLPVADLTKREREVLELLASGRSHEEAATALAIAEKTARNHLKNVLAKLQLLARVQAASTASVP